MNLEDRTTNELAELGLEPTDAELAELDLGGVSNTPTLLAYQSPFDYGELVPPIANQVKAAAERIRSGLLKSIIETGKDLILVKQKLEHGQFGPWLEAEFGWTERTAENYMNVARKFAEKPEIVAIFPPTALYELAAKSTPDAIRDEIVNEAKAGNVLPVRAIKSRIADARSAERQEREAEQQSEREKRVEAHRQKQAEQEWKAKEKDFKDAGKSDAEIEAEKTIWETKKAKNQRAQEKRREQKRLEEEARQRQLDEREHHRKELERLATKLAGHLKKKVGPTYFSRFRKVLEQVDVFAFLKAVQILDADTAEKVQATGDAR
jgi:flagellar biosynthesis GTPase FlhF